MLAGRLVLPAGRWLFVEGREVAVEGREVVVEGRLLVVGRLATVGRLEVEGLTLLLLGRELDALGLTPLLLLFGRLEAPAVLGLLG